MLILSLTELVATVQRSEHERVNQDLKPKDGQIVRLAFLAQLEGRCDEATRLSQLLSDRMLRSFKELQTFAGGKYLALLTPLLQFSALWTDFQPGALNRVMPMRCHEVQLSVRYYRLVH